MSYQNTEKELVPSNTLKDTQIELLNTSFKLQSVLQTLVNGTLNVKDYDTHKTDEWMWVYIALSDAIKSATLRKTVTSFCSEFEVETPAGKAYKVVLQQGLVTVSTNYRASQTLLITYSYKRNSSNQ